MFATVSARLLSSRLCFCLILACVVTSAGIARGANILVRDAPGGEDFAGNQPGNYLTGTAGGLFGTPTGGQFTGLAVGTYDLETDSGAGFQSLRTYCLEATQFLAVGTQPTILFGQPYNDAALTTVAGVSASEASTMQILWANAFADSQTSQDKAAAFQSIIWELVGDSNFNLTQGNFRFNTAEDPGAAAIANAWYANIVNQTWTASTPLRALVSGQSQDILMPIPEPATIVLLAIGAVVLAGARLWRGRRG